MALARYGGIWELEIGRAHTPWFYYSDVRIDDKYRVGVMTEHPLLLAEAVDNIAGIAPLGDDSVKYRLGRSIARMEAAMSTPEMFGRVAIAQTMRDVAPDLMDLLGTASGLPVGVEGAADTGEPSTFSGWRRPLESTAAPWRSSET